jgi:hypothetical protein
MNNLKTKISNFLDETDNQNVEITNNNNVQEIKVKDGLIERTIIEKKLVLEDGRELLREERPISHSVKNL